MKLAVLLALCACGKPSSPPSRPLLSVAADVPGETTLVPGTGRFALRVGTDGWWISEGGTLVEQPDIGAAIAKATTSDSSDDADAHFEIFLGSTPILFGGAEHREHIVRLGPTPREVDTHLEPLEVVGVVTGSREAWHVRDGIFHRVAFVAVDDAVAQVMPPLALVGPPAEATSPVRAKLCGTPKVEDIALGKVLYALVTECHEAAPNRIVAYPGAIGGGEQWMSWPKDNALLFAKLAVSRTDKLHLAGTRNRTLSIDHLIDGKVSTDLLAIPAQVVFAAVVADDEALWVLASDNDRKFVTRNGVVVTLSGEPKALGLDDKLGVVVLTANSLFAERPGNHVVIAPRR